MFEARDGFEAGPDFKGGKGVGVLSDELLEVGDRGRDFFKVRFEGEVVGLVGGGEAAEEGDVGLDGEFGLREEREEGVSGVERGGIGFAIERLLVAVGEAFEHSSVFGVGGGDRGW